jgi:hypothetical protein
MLTRDRVCELFDYDPATGDLIRRVAKANQPAGAVAGSVNAKGHLNVQVDGRLYAAHRLVFLMHHGWLPREIDHENRIKTDNRIGNLRPATSSQNKGNIQLLRTNSSGYRGVSRNSRSGKWHAQIKIHGKQTYLGRADTPEQAAVIYNQAAREHFGEFAYLNEIP